MITQKMFDKKFKKHLLWQECTDFVQESLEACHLLSFVLVGPGVPVSKYFFWIEVSPHLAKLLIEHGGVVIFVGKRQFWKCFSHYKHYGQVNLLEDLVLQNIVDGKKIINDFIPVNIFGYFYVCDDYSSFKTLNLPKKIKDFFKPDWFHYEGLHNMYIEG